MATKQGRKAPSSPVPLTQEQVDSARKGYSRTVFERIGKSSAPMKAKGKSRSRKKA